MAALEPVRDARAEAEQRLDGRYHALVLEPSPPAVGEPWFADDPVDPGPLALGSERQVVSPVGTGDLSWADLCADDVDLAAWCAERSLAAWTPLPVTLPAAFVSTRLALHAVGEHVATAARHRANGKIALRFTIGGFGTPFFWDSGDTRQIRVEHGSLVVQDGAATHRHDLTTLGAAAAAAGVALGAPTEVFTPTTVGDPGATLDIDPGSASLLGTWYGLATSVLEQLRADRPAGNPPARVQLWPEHFDLATDLGDQADGTRVTFGASPGDGPNPEPYLYVLPWAAVTRGGFWNAESFTGAILSYAELAAAADQRRTALEFFEQGSAALEPDLHGE
jgi:hypothetical protein